MSNIPHHRIFFQQITPHALNLDKYGAAQEPTKKVLQKQKCNYYRKLFSKVNFSKGNNMSKQHNVLLNQNITSLATEIKVNNTKC